MAILALIDTDSKTIKHKVIATFGEQEKKVARERFEKYKKQGTILSDFEDDVWEMTNEVQNIKLDFRVDDILIKKYLKNMTAVQVKEYLKYYICFRLEMYALSNFQKSIRKILNVMKETKCFQEKPKKCEDLYEPCVQEFLTLFPEINEELLVEAETGRKSNIRVREMAEYESYFLLDEIINAFWKVATEEQKKLYYPIYIWWNITTILPLRVTEFTLLPNECVYKTEDKWVLRIRRTQLKGEKYQNVNYKISDDYKIFEYEVTEKIAKMIFEYKEFRKNYDDPELDVLLSDKMLVDCLMQRERGGKGFRPLEYGTLIARHLSLLLSYFYVDVIEEIYGYKIYTITEMLEADENGVLKKLKNKEIVKINLGDTRHIAIQNLLLNGCNIIMSLELTGHESADMTYHYAGNMKKLVKCRAYNLYRKANEKKSVIDLERNTYGKLFLDINKKFVEVDGGKCFSENMVNDADAKDCFVVAGECSLCRYFVTKNSQSKEIKKKEQELKKKILQIKEWLNKYQKTTKEETVKTLFGQLETTVAQLETLYYKEYTEQNG